MWTVGLERDIRAILELLPREEFVRNFSYTQVGATREEFPECIGNFSYTRGHFGSRQTLCGHVMCCGVSPCTCQELVRGEMTNQFRYEIGGTWVFTVLLPCGGQFLHFPHVSHS